MPMGMGMIDRLLMAVNPKAAVERAYYREVYRSSYAAADQGRRKEGWTAVNASGEVTNRGDRDIVRARARDLERNDDLIKSIILDLERNVVGTGIMLQAKVRDENGEEWEEINTRIEEAWHKWGRPENCTVTGNMSLSEVQEMAVRRRYIDGGLLVLRVYVGGEYRLQIREVDELDSTVLSHGDNRVVGGIEIDSYNRPVAYHLHTQDISGHYSGKKMRVSADRVNFLSYVTRASQIREFPPSASSLSRADDVNQLLEAALKKEQVQACFSVAITSEGGNPSFPGRGLPVSAPQDEGYPDEYIAPGMIKRLKPGESVSSIAPAGMSSSADGIIRTVQRQAGSGAGLSYEAVSRDMSQVNYSSARQGMLQDRKTYAKWQQYLVDHLLVPVYREWLAWAVLTGKLDLPGYYQDPGRYERAIWTPAGWEWIDPLKEANANKTALATGQTTLQKICAARGEDYRDVIRQRATELQLMRELGIIGEDNDDLPIKEDDDAKEE